MKLIITKDFQESSSYIAEQFVVLLQQNPAAKLGLATGGSAEKIYSCLVEAYHQERIDFSQASSVNLDEYVGLEQNHKQSYCYYMRHHLLDHININKANAYIPNGRADPQQELEIFRQKLQQGVDLQLLGVGANGHIGFNEPQKELIAEAHIENLTQNTIEANSRYFPNQDEVPRQALTQGVGDILKARKVLLIASGDTKIQAVRELCTHNRVSTMCPVTLLKLHPNFTLVIDEALAKATQVTC